MDIREVGGGGMEWTDLAHDSDQRRALVNTGNEPLSSKNSGKFASI